MKMTKLVVLTGAGISAESGLKTFRDSDGLWEGHAINEVATPQAWQANKQQVLTFYNQRRAQLKTVVPNAAHQAIAKLEQIYDTTVITQNVDDLHERAGSTQVIHLHGELFKVRSVTNPQLIYSWYDDLNVSDSAEDGSALRPHIVWFGEDVPLLAQAAEFIEQAHAILIIGTSMQVYPAASLYQYAPVHAPIVYLDPKANANNQDPRIQTIEATAVEGIEHAIDVIKRAVITPISN